MTNGNGSTSALAIDINEAKKPLGDQFNAVAVVLAYCHAILNAEVNPIDPKNPSDWYKTFEPLFKKAQGHAKTFVDDLQPKISSQVPQAIINYNDTFVPATNDIVEFLKPIGNNPLSSAQKQELEDYLNAILSKLRQQKTTIDDLDKALKKFNDALIADHKALFDGITNIQDQILTDQKTLTEIKAKINSIQEKIKSDSQKAALSEIGLGVSIFITVVGIALAFVTFGAGLVVAGIGVVGIGASIAGTVIFSKAVSQDLDDLYAKQKEYDAEEKQISTLTSISNAVEGLKGQNEAAQSAMSAILTTWEVLEGKLQTVIEDLQDSEKEATAILAELDVQSSQLAWADLVKFAEGMQKSWQTVEIVKVEQPKPKAA